jgi:ribose/xylose/arabinose/galactoside ABC-type transport system permease subunit
VGAGNIDLSVPYTMSLTGFVSMNVMNAVDGNIACSSRRSSPESRWAWGGNTS